MNIAIFDFCETIADFQTMDPFLNEVIKIKHPYLSKVISSIFIKKVANICTRIFRYFGYKGYLYKRLLVFYTKGVKENEFYLVGKSYYEKIIKNHFIKESMELFNHLKSLNYKIFIVSGGSRYYIKWFADEYGVDQIFSAEIEMKNEKSTGKLLVECMGEDKVTIINRYMCNEKISSPIDICISDSISDMPLLQLGEKKIIISHMQHQKWVEKDMEEIIWK